MIETIVLQVPLLDVSVGRLVTLLVVAAAGGAFGASIGALPSFVFTGFVVLLGEGLAALAGTGSSVVELGGADLASGVTGTIGFGPVVGPHVAFAGGVAASAYLGQKYAESEFESGEYHPGKDIVSAHGTEPDVLAVGALFGVLGLLVARLSDGLGLPLDGIALAVFLTALVARVAFGYPLVGRPSGDGYLDMTPFERGETRAGNSRPAVEPWLPQQYTWAGVTAIGVVGGVLGGWAWMMTGSMFLAYGISAASLLFLNLGVEDFPVTHHITLGGSAFAAVVAPVAGSEPVIVLVAAVGGLVGALLGELTQRVFYAHSGTHVDPPAMAIVIYSFAIGVLFLLGLLPNSAYLGL